GCRWAAGVTARHADAVEPARNRPADATHADHADGAVAQCRLAQRILPLHPFARAQEVRSLREFAHRAQQQTHRGVGALLVENLGRVGDGDAVLDRILDVDVVVADAEARYE